MPITEVSATLVPEEQNLRSPDGINRAIGKKIFVKNVDLKVSSL
jgi:hypothetical protein